jgi:hypothetical protein
VIAGSGAVQTLDHNGYFETPPAARSVVWFGSGTIRHGLCGRLDTYDLHHST